MHLPTSPDDRGPSKYFHGRDDIRTFFSGRLNHYEQLRGGSIILITGAPGAGKSALLSVLSDDASKMGWCVNTQMTPEKFANPVEMADTLGVKYKSRKTGSATLNLPVYKHFWQSEKEKSPSVSDIIRSAARAQPLLLVLDEAQHLQILAEIPQDKKVAQAVLETLHNGKIGHPVVFLAGGLDTSRQAFGSLGVSRITSANRVRLGPIDQGPAKEVIRDYVCGEFGCEVPENWLDLLASRSQGWPQHLVCYAHAAGHVLASLQRPSSTSDLEDALSEGRSAQEDYYNARAHDITYGQREAIASVFAKIPINGTVRKREVVNALHKGYSKEVAEEKFRLALHQGILNEREDGLYGIPIPSLYSWLVENYASGK
ncbi:MAG: ATP-binding protein [Bacteroidetes bacterium]|nr:ATP-binding protein [Bacteroidota bacterium]